MKKFYVGIKGVIEDPERGILLLRREYKSGDVWDLPGGRIDDNEDFGDTLRRELSEELPGIKDVKIGGLLGAYRVQKDIEDDTSLVLLYYKAEAIVPEPISLSDEHDGYIWVKTVTEIPEGLNKEATKIIKRLL